MWKTTKAYRYTQTTNILPPFLGILIFILLRANNVQHINSCLCGLFSFDEEGKEKAFID